MIDYEPHQVNNVNIVTKILKARKRVSSDGSSHERYVSLQAGALGSM